ncbi:hemerythrin domain-containing protein [Micromonospora sp. URMC 105]|uniref:hemerythrin domain-containing protein n=1 Tax=Micromonospora sp. URMC 105 TaxID=3423413 RepID=UPI003F1CDF85
MQIDENAPRDKPEVAQMTVIHKALRREFRLLPAAVAAVGSGDRRAAQQVAAHADLQLLFLHAHHDSEDRLIWPILTRRSAATASMVELMHRQHETVDRLVTQLRAALPPWARTADPAERQRVVALLEELHPALEEHLDLEEAEVLPLIQEHLTVAEWNATVQDAATHLPKNPKAGLLLAGVVLEDATAAEQRWFLHELPPPARLMWGLLGHRLYRRHVRRTRAAAA